VKNKYVFHFFIKTTLKNSYAVRKITVNKDDYINSCGYTIDTFLYDPTENKFYSHEQAEEDLSIKIIRLVGNPDAKISENRMHLIDAGILLAFLGGNWQLEFDTFQAISKRSLEIAIVSPEAIREAMTILIKYSDRPSLAFRFFKNSGILVELMPWLMRGIGLLQTNKANNLDLFSHIMYCLDSVPTTKHNHEVLRWACIFHDIAKPYTKSYDKNGNMHFLGHDKMGAIFATRWLETYKFDKTLIDKVSIICNYHLFDINISLDEATLQKFIDKVGKEHILDLINMREADRWGTGRKDISMKKVEIFRAKVEKLLK
jgi:tRNA nucleotidyltransferase (CCA-adding enzyme)